MGYPVIEGMKTHFCVTGKGWVAAGDIETGDEIYTLAGSTATVLGLEYESCDEAIIVYNLEVEDFNSYFVGPFGVLVHNYEETDVVEGVVEGAAGNINRNLPVVYDGDFAARQLLNSPTNITPGGRTITAHAAERMVNPPAGRVPTSMADIDNFLDTVTNIRKITPHPLGDTLTLRNSNSSIKEIVVDAATGKRVITVINPK